MIVMSKSRPLVTAWIMEERKLFFLYEKSNQSESFSVYIHIKVSGKGVF